MDIRSLLTAEQLAKLEVWEEQQNQLLIAEQKKSNDHFTRSMANLGMAYTGAVGGAVTFEITQTSIGTIVKVVHSMTKNILDLTGDDFG